MKDILKYVVKEIKRHFHTDKAIVRICGRRRDISRVVTIVKVVVDAIGAWYFIKNLLG